SSLATGDGQCTGAGNPEGVACFGTVREDMQRTTKQGVKHYTSSFNASYQALSPLAVEGTIGVDVVNQLSEAFRPFGNGVDGFINVSPQGNKTVDDITTRIITAEGKATWKRQFGERCSSVLVARGQGFITKTQEEGSFG